MKHIRDLAEATRQSMDEMHAKTSSPGQRFRRLMFSSYDLAARLGYGGSYNEWVAFVKRS